jgi:hypothetical protein
MRPSTTPDVNNQNPSRTATETVQKYLISVSPPSPRFLPGMFSFRREGIREDEQWHTRYAPFGTVPASLRSTSGWQSTNDRRPVTSIPRSRNV